MISTEASGPLLCVHRGGCDNKAICARPVKASIVARMSLHVTSPGVVTDIAFTFHGISVEKLLAEASKWPDTFTLALRACAL